MWYWGTHRINVSKRKSYAKLGREIEDNNTTELKT